MADSEVSTQTCDECGATVYPEHIEEGKAARIEGRLLCPFCVQEVKRAVASGAVPDAALEAPIELVSDADAVAAAGPGDSAIRLPGATGLSFDQVQYKEEGFRRALQPDAPGATRCRVFHSKLNDGSMAYMSEQVNNWIDAHDDVVIKFVTSNIGVVEGKHPDPHLIVTVFY